jgi:hypothetical protein
MRSIWLNQRHRLQELAMAEGLPVSGTRGKLNDALFFGELLTLVPTAESAVRLLHENRTGALSFLEVLANLTDAIEKAEERPSSSEMNGPFHELADFVVEFMNELRILSPTKFE